MKRNVFYFVLLAGIAVSFSSCFTLFFGIGSSKTYKMTVDESVPKDQTVIVTFENDTRNGWFEVKEWSNEWSSREIGEKLYGKDGVRSNSKTQLTVPAGINSFTFNVKYTISKGRTDITYPAINIELKYDLELGKKYVIKGILLPSDSGKGYGAYVGIFDVSGKKEVFLKDWHLGDTD